MKNSINWFIIPSKIFERANNFYNILFDTQLEVMKDDNGDMMAIIGEMDEKSAIGCISSSKDFEVSSKGVMIYLDASGKLDACMNRVIPAGGKIKKPKTSIGEYGYIAHIEDSEGNIIGLHALQ